MDISTTTLNKPSMLGSTRQGRLNLWQRLTEPAESIQKPDARRQARFRSSLFLALALLLGIGTLFTLTTSASTAEPAFTNWFYPVILGISALTALVAYVLNRISHPTVAAALTVGSLSLLPLALIIAQAAVNLTIILTSFMPLAFVLGSALFSTRGLAVLIVFDLVEIVLIPMLVPGVAFGEALAVACILGMLGALIVIAARYRFLLEKDRLAMVLTSNQANQADYALFEKRSRDLALAVEISRSISQMRELGELLTNAVEIIRTRFDLYYTQIYLVDPTRHMLVLYAGTGTAGAELLRRGHRLPIDLASINGTVASERRAIIVPNTANSGLHRRNPLLPDTRSEMAVPLIAAQRVVGVLDLQGAQPDMLTDENLPAFDAIASQLAVAIENATLFAEVGQARAEVEAQARRLTREGWEEFLNAIERSERPGYMYDQQTLVPINDLLPPVPAEPGLAVPIAVTGEPIGTIQLEHEAGAKWTDDEKALVKTIAVQIGRQVENLRLLAQAERYRGQAEAAARRLTRESWENYAKTLNASTEGYVYDRSQVTPLSANPIGDSLPNISLPLILHDEAIGEITIDGVTSQSEEVADLAETIILRLSAHIENLRLFGQNEKRARELETVAAVSTTASTVLNPDELLQSVADLTKERFNLYHAHIYLADESWNTLLLAAGAGEVGRQMTSEGHAIQLDAEKSLVARAARERSAVVVNDVRREASFLPNPFLPETRSEMAVPMIVGDKVIGVFDVQSDLPGHFTEEDASIYATLAAQVGVALQNARLYMEQSATMTQLRELDRLKSSFLANMSHELRTPLNSILGFADVILEELDGPLTENMANDLGLIQKNGQHLLHLINDVLDMAKIESGKMNLSLEKFRVHEIFEEVTSITAPLASAKNLALFIENESDQEVEISADRTRLRQVMINLVNNAIKFTEKGKISMRVTPQAEQVLIVVCDTGIGIPPDKLNAVFQEFTQVDVSSTRKAGGTGLGLPISRRLVEMHGGRLWAESTGVDGEGATFFVELPLEAKLSEPAEKTIK